MWALRTALGSLPREYVTARIGVEVLVRTSHAGQALAVAVSGGEGGGRAGSGRARAAAAVVQVTDDGACGVGVDRT